MTDAPFDVAAYLIKQLIDAERAEARKPLLAFKVLDRWAHTDPCCKGGPDCLCEPEGL